MRVSRRVRDLPPYLFLEIDRLKRKARSEGRDLIDFGIGDPDEPTPSFVVDALNAALKDPSTHKYPLDAGRPEFRAAIAEWYLARFGVKLDPDREILPLIGSKEGLAHAAMAFLDPGDEALIPDPAYPAYERAVSFAGARAVPVPLVEENGFLPDWTSLDRLAGAKTRLIYLNYPNNPTGAAASREDFKRLAEFGSRSGVAVLHDNAYSELYFDGRKPPSFLETSGAKDLGIEFHSLSKTFNMTGWRVGFVCGNAGLVSALAKFKSNVDSGVFSAIQLAGAEALKHSDEFSAAQNRKYQGRRDLLVKNLKRLGWRVFEPRAAFYLWARIPASLGKSLSSAEASRLLLERANIVVTPGNGFGARGEGYLRFALTVPQPRIQEAVVRLEKM